MEYSLEPVFPVLSVTVIVKSKVPSVVGVPVIVPVDPLSASPVGKDPEDTDHE